MFGRRCRIHPMECKKRNTEFAARLRLALKRTSEPVKGPAALALRFNLRHRGASAPISTQTAHKWLKGYSIPRPDKLKTLAQWLDVSEHWLRYGPPPPRDTKRFAERTAGDNEKYLPGPESLSIARKIDQLSAHQRYLVEELVGQLYGEVDDGKN